MKSIIRLFPALFVFFCVTGSGLYAEDVATWSARIVNPRVKAGEVVTIKLTAKITSGWHIYAAKRVAEGLPTTKIFFDSKGPLTLVGKIQQPTPISKYDENFGATTEYFEKDPTFTITAKVDESVKPGQLKAVVKVNFMGCNDRMCMPPKTVSIPLSITVEPGAAEAAPVPADTSASAAAPADTAKSMAAASTPGEQSGTGYGDEQDVKRARQQGFWAYIGLAMSVGALALLTPCVFPMIPITVSFFTKRSTNTRKKTIKEAAIYSFGIIFTFTALGILLAVVFGASGINKLASSPIINLLIAAVFIAFALNLFGLFEIVVPSGLLTKLSQSSEEGSGVMSILLMALTFTLTSFTCTVPFVGTVMVAAASGEVWWAIAGMLAFSAVFAFPFFLLALFPSWLKSLPKSGGWLNSVKVVMGFLELAAAMKFLSNVDLIWQLSILSRDMFLSFWVGIALITAIYLLGVFRLPHDSPVEHVGVLRMLFSIFFIGIGIYLFSGLNGVPLGELDAFFPPMQYSAVTAAAGGGQGPQADAASTEGEQWITDYQQALTTAKQQGKTVLIDFTGFMCTNCRWMEANMFPRKDVQAELKNFVLVRLYTDGQGDIYTKNREMQEKRFGTVALPFYVMMSADDKEIARFPGMTRKPEEFLAFLNKGRQTTTAPAAQ
jgi:thiol:disulfide interchange protein DsbD